MKTNYNKNNKVEVNKMLTDEIRKHVDEELEPYLLHLVEKGWGKYEFVGLTGVCYAKVFYDGHGWDWECDHTYWDRGDIGERGECPICGSTCDWKLEMDVDDSYPEHIRTIEVPTAHTWYEPESGYGGIIDKMVRAMGGEKVW